MLASPILYTPQVSNTEAQSQIAEEVALALRDTGYPHLWNLDVRVDGHRVILQGRLLSYFLKQKAHYAALNVKGVQALIDDIEVVN